MAKKRKRSHMCWNNLQAIDHPANKRSSDAVDPQGNQMASWMARCKRCKNFLWIDNSDYENWSEQDPYGSFDFQSDYIYLGKKRPADDWSPPVKDD